jgi:hypothetical protein
MVVRTKIDPIDRDIALMLDEELSPAAQSAALAQYAREQFAEAAAVNTAALGHAPEHETFVDGARTEQLDRVRPDGAIVFEFELLDEMFGWIDLQLITHSPVKSGRYQRSHVLLADGEVVDPDGSMPDAREYVYINTQPYARKIEAGRSRQAPDGVYQAVAALAARRFGNLARISFGYRAPLFGAVDTWASGTKMKSKGRSAGARAEWLRRQPAIVVTVT